MSPLRARLYAASMISQKAVARGRELFLERYIELDPRGDAVIALSGGVDSTTVLFAARECGFKPQCITFRIKKWPSGDLSAARQLSRWFRFPLEIVELPNTVDGVIEDCWRLIDEAIDWWYVKSVTPTLFQTLHPYLYVFDAARGKTVLGGGGGDLFAVAHRESALNARRIGDPYGIHVRTFMDPERTNLVHLRKTSRAYNCKHRDFFCTEKIFDWARNITVDDYNHPKQKWGHVAPFLDYWKMGPFYRRSSSFQINAGIRDLHSLIAQTEHNHRGRSIASPLTAYRRMVEARGIVVPGPYWGESIFARPFTQEVACTAPNPVMYAE